MKRIVPLVGCCLVLIAAGSSFADPKEGAPVPAEIENEQVLGINKEPAHATLMPYATLKEALAANRHQSSFCQSLNGPWKFNWVAWPQQRPVDFYKPSYDVSGWKEIPVPSNWQVLGYGTPYYRNHGYTFQNDWPHVMSTPPKSYTAYEERNPVGSYRREFEVPNSWRGRRVFITFDGVDSSFFLWINGEKVGYSVNSRNAAEFDVTPYLKPGKNLVAAEVYRYCAGSYLEDQDMWRLSGIFRNVTLWSAPEVHIRDFFIKPDLDAQYRDGTLNITAKVRNFGKSPAAPRILTANLYDRDGKPAAAKVDVNVPLLQPGEEKTVALDVNMANPAKWTAETPNLYTTVLSLGNVGKAEEIISSRTGFRKIEIKGRVFTINGMPVKLKGANRHEHWPETGHYVSEEQMIRDLEVLKQANCNHVRTCHYSDDPRWYELCDEWGIYLNAEANVECHGQGSLSREPRYQKAIVDRNIANVENFKNRPSVVLWSLGNECGSGDNFVAALNAVKEIDQSRPTHYEPFGIGEKNPADIDSQMYASPGSVASIAADSKYTKPYYLCEYAHAMFNSLGSIGEYNDLFDKYPALIGGAIWEWQDQGLWNRRDPKHPILAYGGGFGEVPNGHYFIHKGVVFSDRSPKPHFPEVKRVYQWIGISAEDLAAGLIKIRNKYQFISLDGFNASWTLSEDGRVVDQGNLGSLHIAPGSEQTVKIQPKEFTPAPGAEYFLKVSFTLAKDEPWAKAGYEVASEQFKLPIETPATVANTASMKPVRLDQNAQQITVSGDGFSVVFDKAEGTISQLVRDGKPLLLSHGGPKLNLWRAPHQKDDMWAYEKWALYGLPSLTCSTIRIGAEPSGNAAVRVFSAVKAEGKEGFEIVHSAVYTVYGDGSIAVDNAVVFPREPRIPLARIGVRLMLDKQLDQFSFLGRGPMENYSDRKRGFDVGLYSSTVKEQQTPYAKPMECGNHEDVRWAALTGSGFPGLLAQADGSLLQVSALPYTDEQMTPPEYSIDLPESTATVLNVCARTLGVGSNGCGPIPLQPYMLWSDSTTFSYVLRLLPTGAKEVPGRLSVPKNRVKPVLGQRDEKGQVTLQCETAGAKIEYAVSNGAFKAYSGPFEFKSGGIVAVRASASGEQAFEGAIAFAPEDPRVGWKIVSASSFQKGEGEPAHAFDNRPSTYWHSRWNPDEAKFPHELVIDFGKPCKVGGIVYQGRDGSNGRVKEYEVYLSADGQTWGVPVAKGQFEDNVRRQTAPLPHPISAQYMKFVALSEVHGRNFASIAELDIVRAE